MAASSRIATNFVALLGQPRYQRRCRTTNPYHCLQVRAHGQQGFRDEGSSKRHIDEANLRLLRDRMEVIRMKENLERCIYAGNNNNHDDHHRHAAAGWNNGYASAVLGLADCSKHYKEVQHKLKQFDDILEVLTLVCCTFGITVLSGTLCLCLASILVHLNH